MLMVFPGDVEFLMPDPALIPDEYRSTTHPLYKMTNEFIFTQTTPADLEFKPRIDLDYLTVARHMYCIAASFQPKHEDKRAGLMLLFDGWFPGLVDNLVARTKVQEGQ